MQKKYHELPMDDLSGKEVPTRTEIRAQQQEQTAAAKEEKHCK